MDSINREQLIINFQVHETAREKATLIGANPEIIPRSIPSTPIKNTYILGPGDQVVVEILDVPEYSGIFTIGPDGTIYLPRLRSLLVEGLTIEELSELLTQKFSSFVLDPQVFVSSAYTGLSGYTLAEKYNVLVITIFLTAGNNWRRKTKGQGQPRSMSLVTGQINTNEANFNSTAQVGPQIEGVKISRPLTLPTVFDALRIAGGVTPFSKLSEVSVTRRRPLSRGGGKMRAKLNFLELITDGNETQNIRLFDGDSVLVARSPIELREQIIKAGQTNLSPDFIQVFVSGRVREPGPKVLPQGATLDQAIAAAGDKKYYAVKWNSSVSIAMAKPTNANFL